jgi:hypothetical protein
VDDPGAGNSPGLSRVVAGVIFDDSRRRQRGSDVPMQSGSIPRLTRHYGCRKAGLQRKGDEGSNDLHFKEGAVRAESLGGLGECCL